MRDKRAWKTWQLCVMVGLTFLLGLYIESLSRVKPVAAISHSYHLPPPAASGSSSSATTTPSSQQQSAGGGATSTTVAPGGSPSGLAPTTAPASAPASAPATGQVAIVLVPRYPAGSAGATGSWTSPSFTVTSAPWNIGWAYACAGSNPSFTVTVGPGTTSAVSGTQPSGQGVTPQSTTGTFTITATGSAGCQWAVKVTGIGTPAG